MYSYLVLDTVTNTEPGGILPSSFTLEHWRFLYEDIEGKANIWQVTLNTLVFRQFSDATGALSFLNSWLRTISP